MYGSGLSVALRRSRRLDKALKAAEVREAAELAEVERLSLLEFKQAGVPGAGSSLRLAP